MTEQERLERLRAYAQEFPNSAYEAAYQSAVPRRRLFGVDSLVDNATRLVKFYRHVAAIPDERRAAEYEHVVRILTREGSNSMTTELSEKLAELLAEMRVLAEDSDWERAHSIADDRMVRLVELLVEALPDAETVATVRDILDHYETVGKWYA